MKRWIVAFVVAVASLSATLARADVRRVAVVVGNNEGSAERPSLHFAEADAEKLSQVLVELGGFTRSDVYLLRGLSAGRLRDVLSAVRQKVAIWRAKASDARILLLFYFSGHSNGQELELGSERFPFAELKQWLAQTGSDVRLTIVDSCKSGSVVETKGGVRGSGFEIHLTDSLGSKGEAFLTSSAANEAALESEELGGSFFSHNLISGMRGAADFDGDGRVTLSEAYQHAFAKTLAATTNTVYGPQHPTYDYRLSGNGDVMLTEIGRPPAAFDLPTGFDRIVVTTADRERMVAEVGVVAARRISVQPGAYGVYAWRGRDLFGGRFDVALGQVRAVSSAELLAQPKDAATAKGWADEMGSSGVQPSTFTVEARAGVSAWVSAPAPVLAGARIAVRPPRGAGPVAALELGTSVASLRGSAVRQSLAMVGGGYQVAWGWSVGRVALRPAVGFEVAAGYAGGDAPADSSRDLVEGVVASAGPTVGVDWLLGAVNLSTAARLPVYVGRRGKPSGSSAEGAELEPWLGPAIWLGISLDR